MNNGAPKASKTQDELLNLAREQIDFMLHSSREFDAGRASEAKRIAVALRVLLHSTAASHALLEQTGHRDRLWIPDTAGPINPRNLATENRLVFGRMHPAGRLPDDPGPDYEYRSNLSGGAPTKPGYAPGQFEYLRFDDWWSQDVIRDDAKHLFSRRRLVLALANEEGGAHVDPKTKADYAAVAHSNSLGWEFVRQDEDGTETRMPFGSPVPASVRQIAWELELALQNRASELLA